MPDLLEELNRLQALVRAGECRLVEQAIAPFAKRLLEEALGIRDGIEGTLVAAWLVRRKAAEVLSEEPEEAEKQPGSDLDELIQELEVVRALVDQVEDIEVGSFRGRARTAAAKPAAAEPGSRRPPAVSPASAGFTLDDLERELQSAAEVLPPVRWYPVEEVREEILARLRAGETIDLEAFRAEASERLVAGFSAALEVVKDGAALGRQKKRFGRILLLPAKEAVGA